MKKQRFFALLLAGMLLSGCAPQTPAPSVSADPTASVTALPEKEEATPTAAPQNAATDYESSVVGFFFDTVITLDAYCKKEVLQEALECCRFYESILSKTVENSDIWKINHANGQPVEIHEETARVLSMALQICDLTKGVFDISIEPVVNLWDFTGETAVLPQETDLAAALEKVDYRKIHLEGNTVSLPAGMSIDLGGIAKGFIADELAAFLRERGVKSGLINLGGNILAIGSNPENGRPWRIGIQDPDQSRGAYISVVQVSDATVVTSGIYERGFDLEGVRYHHLLDTQTGYPHQNGLASVSIITGSSMLADALSTACFALGPVSGMELAEAFKEVEAVFVTTDGDISYSTGLQ